VHSSRANMSVRALSVVSVAWRLLPASVRRKTEPLGHRQPNLPRGLPSVHAGLICQGKSTQRMAESRMTITHPPRQDEIKMKTLCDPWCMSAVPRKQSMPSARPADHPTQRCRARSGEPKSVQHAATLIIRGAGKTRRQ